MWRTDSAISACHVSIVDPASLAYISLDVFSIRNSSESRSTSERSKSARAKGVARWIVWSSRCDGIRAMIPRNHRVHFVEPPPDAPQTTINLAAPSTAVIAKSGREVVFVQAPTLGFRMLWAWEGWVRSRLGFQPCGCEPQREPTTLLIRCRRLHAV
jgi:hypothetical protein